MTMPEIFTAVIMANAVCLAMWYAAWRIRKNERDLKAIGLMMGCFLFIALMGWASNPPPQAQETGQAHSSAVAAPVRQ